MIIMAVTKFFARQGTFAYGTSAVTWDSSTQADAETLTADVASLKNVTVEPPKQEFEKVDCIGNIQQTIGANHQTVGTATGGTPGYFQAQAMIAQSIGVCKISGTAVFTGDEQFFHLMGLGTSQAITGGNTRYGIGTLTSGAALTANTVGVLRLFLNNSSEDASAVATNVHMTIGEVKPTGTDGHYEADFEAVCLTKDFFFEFKD
jgi:hypothetical protein